MKHEPKYESGWSECSTTPPTPAEMPKPDRIERMRTAWPDCVLKCYACWELPEQDQLHVRGQTAIERAYAEQVARAEKAEKHNAQMLDDYKKAIPILQNAFLMRAWAQDGTMRHNAELCVRHYEELLAAKSAENERLREALCFLNTDHLRLLAMYFDHHYPDDPQTQVQDDLRAWADKIDAALHPTTEGDEDE